MSKPLTDEQLRILIAIDEGRMKVNSAGRYVIDEEARPDRKSREQLRDRGLIDHYYERGRGSHWRLTATGRKTLRAELESRIAARQAEVERLQSEEGLSFPDAYAKALK